MKETTESTDPIGQLAKVLTDLDAHTQRSHGVLLRNERNRLNLLVVHAIAAMIIAPLFVASRQVMSGPSWELLRYFPGFPESLGIILGAGGLILLIATLARHRIWEMVGLVFLNTWYTSLAIGFAWPAFHWIGLATHAAFTGGSAPAVQPGLYAWCVYAHVAVVMRVHLWTLWRMRKADRRAGVR